MTMPRAIAAPTLAVEHVAELDTVTATVGIPAGATRLWLWRVNPTGYVAYVRGAQDAAVVEGDLAVHDFEAPLGVELVYHALVASATEQSPEAPPVAITVPAGPSDDPWLVDLGQVANTQRVVVERLAELAYDTPTGIHYVLGRRTPIVTSDIANAPRFELAFVTGDEQARERARAALGDGTPLLLRTPPEQGVGNLYFAVTDWREQRPSRLALHGDRRFVVACAQVDRPDALLWVPELPAETYADVAAAFADYAELEAERATYDELLHTPIGPSPPADPVVPWPPDDL